MPNGNGDDYEPYSSYPRIGTISAPVTLYAKWKPNTSSTVSVTFNGNGATSGTLPSSMSVAIGSTIITPEAGRLKKAGYTFAGWMSSDTFRVYQEGVPVTVTQSITLSAQWTTDLAYWYPYQTTATGEQGPVSLKGSFCQEPVVIAIGECQDNRLKSTIKGYADTARDMWNNANFLPFTISTLSTNSTARHTVQVRYGNQEWMSLAAGTDLREHTGSHICRRLMKPTIKIITASKKQSSGFAAPPPMERKPPSFWQANARRCFERMSPGTSWDMCWDGTGMCSIRPRRACM